MNKEHLDQVYVKPSPQRFAYSLDGDIGEPSDYRELSQLLNTMQEGDELELTICSFGGYLHTTVMLSSLIRNCQGHVHGILAGVAMSGGSLLLLSCHSVEVMPHSQLMAHTSNGFDSGKLSDKVRSVQSSAQQLSAFYKDIYYGFYSEEEIQDILDGKDSYLEYDEICRRLEQREEVLKKDFEAQRKQDEQHLSEMFSELDELAKLPDWVLSKLNKKQLFQYINGEVDFDIDEDSKKITVVPIDTEEDK
jgi:ATP-dependent protease ClpP protease subunit